MVGGDGVLYAVTVPRHITPKRVNLTYKADTNSHLPLVFAISPAAADKNGHKRAGSYRPALDFS